MFSKNLTKRLITIILAVVLCLTSGVSAFAGVIEVKDPKISAAVSGCTYGALYENDFMRYGLAKLYLPDYFLYPGEGDETDYMMSPDQTTMLSATRQFEVFEINYAATDKAGLEKSLKSADPNASIVDFQMDYVDGFPVVRYIANLTAGGVEQYVGEMIIFPYENTKETIRIYVYRLAESGYDEINSIFDSLYLSPDNVTTFEETQTIGLNRIVVK